MMKNVMMMKGNNEIIIEPGEVLLITTNTEELAPGTLYGEYSEMKSILINKNGIINIKFSIRMNWIKIGSGLSAYYASFNLKKNGITIHTQSFPTSNTPETMINVNNINVSIGDTISLEGRSGYVSGGTRWKQECYSKYLGLYGNTFTTGFGTIING